MKKFLMVALVAAGMLTAAAPKSKAGISVGIGVGFPGYYPAGYCGYPYYPGYYPYGYPVSYYRPAVSFGYRPYYGWHGRRIYYRRCRR